MVNSSIHLGGDVIIDAGSHSEESPVCRDRADFLRDGIGIHCPVTDGISPLDSAYKIAPVTAQYKANSRIAPIRGTVRFEG